MIKIISYGHSSFAAAVGGKTLLFDPYISENELAKNIDIKTIHADYILVTHAHEDHLGDTLQLAKQTGATVISNAEVSRWLRGKGVQKVQALNHGGARQFEFGRVKFVNAVHSSAFPDGTYGGNPGGFVVESADGNLYHSGDTALTMDMKLIGESTKLTFAGLCIGDNFTMGIDDAIKAADFIQCNEILGMHYNTFPPIRIDSKAAIEKFKHAGKTLHLLNPGDTHTF